MEPGAILRNNYRVERLIGRGGMADVYLAFDMRRQAHVALKVLREDFAEDPDFIRRFAREAEALAKLDHPNIVRFYSFERQGATAFIVMDYVQGSSLQRRIAESDGPLPLDEITDTLHQAGAALQYAHNEGYVHRDIKPGNIMLRENGEVLLSDFGIARAAESATAATVAVGTPAYMSPEQILGRELDRRTDVYSLGVVLYEVASGRRPFTGDEQGMTGTSTLARLREAHLTRVPPDPRTYNPALPAGVAEAILRALAKEPAERYPDVLSLVQAWERAAGRLARPASAQAGAPIPARSTPATPQPEAFTPPWATPVGATPSWATPAGATPPPARPPAPARRGRNVWPLVGGAGALGLILLAVLVWQLVGQSAPAAGRPTETPAPDLPATAQALVDAGIRATVDAQATLQARVDEGVKLTAQAGATSAPTGTNPPLPPTLAPALTLAPGATALAELRCTVVYTGAGGMNMRAGPGQAYAPPLRTIPKYTALRALAYEPQGVPSGEWVQVQIPESGEIGWVRAGPQYLLCDMDVAGLPTVPVPPTPTLSATGPTPATAQRTATATPTATTGPSAPARALLAYTVTEKFRDHYLVNVINSDGSGARLLADRASEPSFSPDGRQVVFFAWPGGLDVMNLDGSGRRTALHDGEAAFPAWSPDGKWIAFHSMRGSRFEVFVIRPDGRDERMVADGEQASWSPDSRRLVYKGCLVNDCGLMVVNSDGSGKRRLTFSANDGNADWSRDINRIAFTSERDGNHEIYVVNPDGSGLARLTNSPGPDAMPAWLPGGQQIAFRSVRDGNWAIWIMNADGSGAFKVTDAKVDPNRWIWEKMAATRR